MVVYVIGFTNRGCEYAKKIASVIYVHDVEVYSKTSSDVIGTKKVKESLSDWAKDAMARAECIIFVGATGIAVRAIAPYIKDKRTDPAVLCIDEEGKFVISLLSGHIGGANYYTMLIAERLNAIPVVSTATDINGCFAVDVFAMNQDMYLGDREAAKNVSAWILDGKDVGFSSEFPVEGRLPSGLVSSHFGDLGIFITSKKNEVGPFDSTLILRPRCYTLGIGCKKGTPIEKIELLVDCVLDEANISIKNVKKVASIDMKKEEKGLLDFCEKYVIPCVFFTAKELNILENEDFSSSQFVQSVTNVDCVCERAAVAASNDGKLIVKKTVLDGVTVAVVKETFRVNFTE